MRRRTRIAALLALAALGAGIFVASAAALAFTDDSCDNTKPCRPPHGVVGSPYSHILNAMPNSGNGPPYSFEVISGSLPPGLSLASNGPITGTPTQSGTWTFWVELSDKPTPPEYWCKSPTRLSCAQRDFTITIDPGLVITTNSIPQTASVGTPYSTTLQAQLVTNLSPLTGSAPGALEWTVVPGFGTGLPPGLSLANGVISGTPTTEGSYTFRIQAAVDPTITHFQTYSLTVRQPLTVTPSKPLATPPAPTLWEVGLPFDAKLAPSGGNGTYTFALAEGTTLPAGLALAADGTISGTPSTAGVSRATIRVTDGEGRTLDYVLGFGVARKLAVSTKRLKLGKGGRLYRMKLSTTGGLPPKTWRAVSGKLPKGVRLDRKLGVISGMPVKVGVYPLTLEARDGLKVTATKSLRIVVRR